MNKVVQFLDELIVEACSQGASDIHLSPSPSGFTVSYRIDGQLTERVTYGEETPYEELISRLKVVAKMNMAQRLLPQDGHFQRQVEGRLIDLRVAIIPSIDGEAAVLRLFDREKNRYDLNDLGLEKELSDQLTASVNEPSGMILVAGPIGSGKTTTLYALLARLAKAGKKIMTIEDPVESRIEGAIQVCVNERSGLTFAKGLKAIVRHDPDVIMIGEIRDGETARIAVSAAVLGHVVLATIHAESAMLAVERLLHLDVERYQLALAFNCVLAQRLIPRASGKGRVGIFEAIKPSIDFKRHILTSDGLLNDSLDGLWSDGEKKIARGLISKEALVRELPAKRRKILPLPTKWLDEKDCRHVLETMQEVSL